MESIHLPLVDRSDKKALRQFGLGFALLLLLVFCGVLPWLFEHPAPLWPLPPAALLLVFAVVWPTGLYWPYRVWMLIAGILGFINTRIIMLLAYVVLIVPIGITMQLLNKLQYQRHPKKAQQSYWIKRQDSPSKHNLTEPF